MGCMSASDAAPLPRLGEVFFDVRGSSRSMRLSWYSDTGVAVFSIWQGGTCTGTFRLPIDDLPRMVEALQRGPRGAALPAADGRDLTGDRPRRGIAGVPADLAVTSVGGFPDYATGQQIAPPVTGEFRSLGPGDSSAGFPGYGDAGARNTSAGSAGARRLPGYGDASARNTSADRQLSQQPSPAASLPGADSRNGDPSYAGDPLGSGSYPVYRDPEGPGASFPGYADDGPPPPSAYRDPSPPSYRDDPLGGSAPSYRDDPLGGSAPSYRDDPLGGSAPSYRDDPLGGSAPSYRDDPLGGSAPSYRDDPLGGGSYRDHPSGSQHPLGPGSYQGRPSGPQHPLDAPGPPSPLDAPAPLSPLGPGRGYREESLPGHRDGGPSYAGDPLGSGSYPVYRDPEGPGASFPGYADDGPPPPSAYRDPSPPSYRDDPLGGGSAPSYRDDPLGGGSYRDHPSGPQHPLGPGSYQDRPSGPQHQLDAPGPPSPLGPGRGYREESLPGYRDSGPPYAGDPLGSGSFPAYRDRDPYPPSRDEPGTYPGDHPGQRYADDPFQSVYPDGSRDPAGPARPVGYPDGTGGGSHPYDLPPERPEQRVPRGRS